MKNSIIFKRLSKKVSDLYTNFDGNYDDSMVFNHAVCAIQCAEENAVDTVGTEKTEEYYRIALGSISPTSYFDENKDVQELFIKLQYKW